MLNIGVTSRAFSGLTIYDTAVRMKEAGFRCCELCLCHEDLPGWEYNGAGDLSGMTAARVSAAADEFRGRGIDVVSLGLFTNLLDGGEAYMDAARRYIEFAAEAKIPYVASECGFRPGRRGICADTYEADYYRLKETLRVLCLEAEAAGVHLCLEGCVLDVIPSPRRMKNLIEELEAECEVRLGALLDPANYIANSDEEGMFYYLKHDIAYFHGKDRKMNATYGVNVGDGDIDWEKFMECYIRYANRKPFILEYCNADNCAEIKARAEDYYEDAFSGIINRLA